MSGVGEKPAQMQTAVENRAIHPDFRLPFKPEVRASWDSRGPKYLQTSDVSRCNSLIACLTRAFCGLWLHQSSGLHLPKYVRQHGPARILGLTLIRVDDDLPGRQCRKTSVITARCLAPSAHLAQLALFYGVAALPLSDRLL